MLKRCTLLLVTFKDGIVDVGKLDDRQHRSKDFFIVNLHSRFDICENGGLDEMAASRRSDSSSSGNETGFFLPNVNVLHDDIELLFRHLRSLLCLGIEGIAGDSDTLSGSLGRFFNKGVVNGILREIKNERCKMIQQNSTPLPGQKREILRYKLGPG